MKILNFSIILIIVTLFSCSKAEKRYNQGINIVPKPNSIVSSEGKFEITSTTKLFVSSAVDMSKVENFLKSRLQDAAGLRLEGINQKPESDYISIEVDKSLNLAKEAYKLTSTAEGITIKASHERGAFYGVVSLVQLLPAEIESKVKQDNAWSVPFVEINDAPRFPWRGMHLDVCRHFVSVEFIKKQLDVLAMYKINTFHWHLTEDQGWRIEIKKYPKLTEVGSRRVEGNGKEYGGFYTQQQVKEIVAYAAERYIDVVPEIELPGHALAAVVAYPHLTCNEGPFKVRNIWGVEADVYCAGKESTFKFLEDVIAEVIPLFPSVYFHIGGDECPKKRWEKCKLCQKRIKNEGLKNEHQLQSYFIKRIEKVLLAHGKKMIGWDEILEGGLAPSATVMSWRGEKGGIEAANQGHDVVMTPGNWVYLDHYQGSKAVEPIAIGGYTTLEESYSYDPIPAKIDKDKQHHILGTQGNVWSEYMYTDELFEHRIYPRIIALAEVNWTQKANKDYKDFTKRMVNQYVRLDYHDINYHIPMPEGNANTVAFIDDVKLKFTTTRPIKMVYTVDGAEPTANSMEYLNDLTFKSATTLKIRTVLETGKLGNVRTITLEKQIYAKASSVKTTSKGLTFSTTRIYPKGEKAPANINMKTIRKLLKDDNAVHTFTGYIEVPVEGVYLFNTDNDKFFINNKLLIDNSKDVKKNTRNNAQIALAKGKHAIKIVIVDDIRGGWPSSWTSGLVKMKNVKDKDFIKLTNDSYSF